MRPFLSIFFSLPLYILSYPGFHPPWGAAHDLDDSRASSGRSECTVRSSFMVRTAEKVIWFHQNILSPVDGPRSHFRPSSSAYMLAAIKRHGFLKGYILGCDRLLRENSEKWIYPTIEYDGHILKWDPPPEKF